MNYKNPITSGFELYRLGNDFYQFKTTKSIFKGDLDEVCNFVYGALGFDLSEIEIAILEMNSNNHKVAKFGILKSFLYTTNETYEDSEKNITVH